MKGAQYRFETRVGGEDLMSVDVQTALQCSKSVRNKRVISREPNLNSLRASQQMGFILRVWQEPCPMLQQIVCVLCKKHNNAAILLWLTEIVTRGDQGSAGPLGLFPLLTIFYAFPSWPGTSTLFSFLV